MPESTRWVWPHRGAATPPALQPDALPMARRIAVLDMLAAGGLAALAVRWGVMVARLLAYPYEWSSMDGYFVGYAHRLYSGLPIYSDHAVPPSGFAYVPGYLLPLGLLNRLFGNGVWVERLLAAGLTVAIAALAGHIVRRRARSVAWGSIASALVLAPNVLVQWHLVRGVDLLVLFFSLAATAVVAEPQSVRLRNVLIAAVLYVAGFYCKQTAVFPWAAGLVILLGRKPRAAFVLGGASVVLGLAVGFALQTWSDGWFWNNAFEMTSRHPYTWRLFVGLLIEMFAGAPLVMVGAVAVVCARPRILITHPWALFWASCVAITGLATKLGAAVIYFMPAYVASVILLCQAAPAWLRAIPPGAVRLAVSAVALMQVVYWLVRPLPMPDETGAANAARLLAAIEARPGRVLAERADSFGTLAGRDIEWEAVQVPILHKMHGMPLDALLEDLREQRYAAVLYSGKYFSRVYWLRKTIYTYYQPVPGLLAVPVQLFYGQEPYTLLEPKPPELLPAEPLIPPEAER